MIFPASYTVIDASNVERYHSILIELRTTILRSIGTCDVEDFVRENELVNAVRSLKKAIAHCESLLAEKRNAAE